MSSRIIIVGLAMLVITFTIQLLDKEGKIYGNDQESIVKVIHSIPIYEHSDIVLLDFKDWGDYRVAGFLSNQAPACILFQKNKKGNYKMVNVESHGDDRYSVFLPSLFGMNQRIMMVVSSGQSGISKLQVDVNNQLMEVNLNPDSANVKWFTLPDSSSGSYGFRNYRVYDEEGKLME